METYVTPLEFGARADGAADDTRAIRQALDAASRGNGVVYFPAGVYRTDCLDIPARMLIRADETWSYTLNGRAVIEPLREGQLCVFNLSNAVATTVSGLTFDGLERGRHGLYMDRESRTERVEHSLRIEGCRVTRFTGDGVHLEGAFAVSLRQSMCSRNGGYGCYLDGTDGFILDCCFSANGVGFGGDTWNSAVNFTANRVEWNRICGVRLSGGMRYNLTGNYIDRSFGPAIVIEDAPNEHKRLHKTHTVMPYAITVTGNTIVRSGREAEPGSDDDCHIRLRRAAGVVVTGNTFNVWKDDGPGGRVSPWYGIVLEECAHCVVTANAMLPGAVKELIRDKGGHGPGMIVKDNPGQTVPEAALNCRDPFTPVHFLAEGDAPWYADRLKGERNR